MKLISPLQRAMAAIAALAAAPWRHNATQEIPDDFTAAYRAKYERVTPRRGYRTPKGKGRKTERPPWPCKRWTLPKLLK